MNKLDPNNFVIVRKRKKYKFALFNNNPICFELSEWHKQKCNIIEIGAGTGLFSLSLAKAHPNNKVLAIDVKGDRLQTGAEIALRDGVNNIKFLRTRADQLDSVVRPKSVSGIWLTFSDPFPKSKSSNRRLTSDHYLKIYKQFLKKNGCVFFKTDSKDFFDWSLEQFTKNGFNLRELSFDLHNSNLEDEYKAMTSYEKKFVSQGLKIMFVKACLE